MEEIQPGTPAPAQSTDQTTTPTRIDATSALDAMSTKQRETWRETGKLPDSIAVVPDGETEKPQPVAVKIDDEAPALDAKGQPVTGQDGKPLSRRQQKINDYERRIAEQDQRIKALEGRQAPVPPKTDEKPVVEAAKPAADAEPVLDDFLNDADPYLSYSRALAKWEVRQELKARDTAAQASERGKAADAEVLQVFTTYQERETAFKAEHPDFDAKTLPVRQQLDMTSPLSRAVVTSDVAPALILHFAEHPEDFERIGALGMRDMAAALRAIGRLESKYDTTGEDPASAAVQPKHVTSAPKPVTQLGTRSADAVDPVEGAIKKRDVGAYIRERNARDLAAAR